jgi:hypothetical protein
MRRAPSYGGQTMSVAPDRRSGEEEAEEEEEEEEEHPAPAPAGRREGARSTAPMASTAPATTRTRAAPVIQTLLPSVRASSTEEEEGAEGGEAILALHQKENKTKRAEAPVPPPAPLHVRCAVRGVLATPGVPDRTAAPAILRRRAGLFFLAFCVWSTVAGGGNPAPALSACAPRVCKARQAGGHPPSPCLICGNNVV